MADWTKEEIKEKLMEQKTSLQAKKSVNASNVKFITEPPGELEPTDDRRRKGIQRMEYRQKFKPNIPSFVYTPLLQPGATLGGATIEDKTSVLFHNRVDWEKNAPRFHVSTPSGDSSEPTVLSLGMQDFWYDKQMYGKVELNQVPIYPSENYLLELNQGDMSIMTMNFVAHQWRMFEKAWSKLWGMTAGGEKGQRARSVYAQHGLHPETIFKPDTNGHIPVSSAWVSVHPLYHDHMSGVFSQFQQWLRLKGRHKKVLTFKDWVRSLMYYFDSYAPNLFLTRSAFVMSRKCPRSISGLEIRLADEDPNNDIIKKTYMSDPNYEMFVAMLQKYGFSVDFNCPWRITADVNSTPMRESIRLYAVEGRWAGVSKSVLDLRNEAKKFRRLAGKVQPSQNSETESSRLLKRAEEMDRAAQEAETRNLDTMFKTCYYRTDHQDLLVLMNYILSWWNDWAVAFPVERIAKFVPNNRGPAEQTVTVEYYRRPVAYDGSTNPSDELLRDPYSILAGKSVYRRSGARSANNTKPSSWDVWSSHFGGSFGARFYMFVRAREAAVTWDQRTFDKNVKMLSHIQKYLDGSDALDYINRTTTRLPSPGGNPRFRHAQHKSMTYDVLESREREFAGRGNFMLTIK